MGESLLILILYQYLFISIDLITSRGDILVEKETEKEKFNILDPLLQGLAGREETVSVELDGLRLKIGKFKVEFHGEVELDISTG